MKPLPNEKIYLAKFFFFFYKIEKQALYCVTCFNVQHVCVISETLSTLISMLLIHTNNPLHPIANYFPF